MTIIVGCCHLINAIIVTPVWKGTRQSKNLSWEVLGVARRSVWFEILKSSPSLSGSAVAAVVVAVGRIATPMSKACNATTIVWIFSTDTI